MKDIPEIDKKIGDLQTDGNGKYRIIDQKKIYQIEEKTDYDSKFNENINRVGASGMSPTEFMRKYY